MTVTFSSGLRTIFPYRDPIPLSYADYIGLPRSLSLIPYPHIFDRPLSYPVALRLSSYRSSGCYHVRYIDPQSGGTVSLGLCPLRLVTLFARVSGSI